MIGIYGIHNLLNDKWYVGQSINIDLRWKHHRCALDNKYHYNRHLLRSWLKYGADNFEFVVLEECNVEELNEKEKSWISKLQAYTNGYNICEGGDGTLGCKWSEESKRDFAESRLGEHNPFYNRKHSTEWKEAFSKRQQGEKNHLYGRLGKSHHRSKPIRCVETNIVYYGHREAERQTGINRNNICSCCTGKLKTAGGYHWEYVNLTDRESG